MPNKEYSQPLNGGLDTKSADGSLGPGWFRMLLNVDGSEPFQMCCLGGWQRRMRDSSCYNNQDLHDQMTEARGYSVPYSITTEGYVRMTGTAYPNIPIYTEFQDQVTDFCGPTLYLPQTCRESITFLKSVTSLSGGRKLIAGTHSRVFVSDDRGGNWRIIADGLGGACQAETFCNCSPVRMRGATLGNYTLMTNGVDEVLYWLFDSGPEGCYSWSADYVQELRELNVASAGGVVEYGGFILIYDVRMDGQDYPGRVLWSDFNSPLSWIPGGESVAGFHDFGRGEKILSVLPIGGRLRFYTNRAIYDAVIVTDERTFAIQERCRATGSNANLPVFRNAIVNCGAFHFWVGQDDLYMMAEYDTSPQSPDWLSRAGGVIYQGAPAHWTCGSDSVGEIQPINRSACDNVVVGWSQLHSCIVVSWPTGTNTCPNWSLWIWPTANKASLVDYGFTAFAEHQPDDSESWRDFFGRLGVCDPTESLLAKEGESCPVTFEEVEYTGLWNATEDTDMPMDPNSVAALFCGMCIDDLCRICESDNAFLMASATDKTIKEFTSSSYVREELIEIDAEAFPSPDIGEYRDDTYTCLIQSDADKREGPVEKIFRQLNVGYHLGDTTASPSLCASVGGGYSPSCLQWEKQGQLLECGDNGPRMRGGKPTTFSFYTEGIWLAWRLEIDAANFCGVSIDYRLEPAGCW